MTPTDRPPSWVADAIFYQVFPDRYARSAAAPPRSHLEPWDAPPTTHGYKGGDLAGVVERLDWITDLGCDAIYFNPIFQSASNHRYHTHDYFRVDPLLGGNDAFEDLLAACHERGVRVVLDGVFNHASRGFFQFNDLLESGEASPWREWFHVNGFPIQAYGRDDQPASSYTAWWGIPALPKFNTENPEVREFLMRVGEYWIDRGIDGWRLDVPEEIATEGFWEEFRTRVREKNPDAYLVGEIWTDASAWTVPGTRFDGTMNYLLTGAIMSFVGALDVDWELARRLHYPIQPTDAAGFAGHLERLAALYPPLTARAHLTLLGSHDTARALSILGGSVESMILAILIQFTMPGAPSIYYGDEVGLTGGHDPDCRAGFPWDRPGGWNMEILEAVRELAHLRATRPELRGGTIEVMGSAGSLVVYGRPGDDRRTIVAVNAGDHAANVAVSGKETTFKTLWGSGGISAGRGEIRIAMAPRMGAVWECRA